MLVGSLLRHGSASDCVSVGRLQSENLVDEQRILAALYRRQVQRLLRRLQAPEQVQRAVRHGRPQHPLLRSEKSERACLAVQGPQKSRLLCQVHQRQRVR